jgi:hypothetical protein
MPRLDLIEAQVDALTRISQASHLYGLLPSSYSPLTRQQLLQVVAVSLGYSTYEDLKNAEPEHLISDPIKVRQRIHDLYIRNNPSITTDKLERCVSLISHLISSIMFLRATYRSIMPPQHMRAIKDLKLPKPNPKLLKSKQYDVILESIYRHAIDDTNWPRILILPIAHNYFSQIDNNNLVNIDICECFNKSIDKEKIEVFHMIWMENLNDFLPEDQQLFISDDMDSFKQHISTFTKFTASANPLLTVKGAA